MAPARTRSEIVEGFKECLQRLDGVGIDVESLAEDKRIDTVGFDSLSLLDFMYEVETAFGIEMDVSDLVEMNVVGDLIDLVEARLGA